MRFRLRLGVRVATEDAALFRTMVKFRASERRCVAEEAVELRCQHHAEHWRHKVNPAARPDTAGQCRGNRARGIHAHLDS